MHITEKVSLAPYTTFHVGGAARFFCTVTTAAELKEACAFAADRHIPLYIMGGGSNILVSDKGFDGLVIHMNISGMEFLPGIVRAYAGTLWDECVAETVKKGWYGLENLSLIPGTVGAAPIQNIGAYGVEVGSFIQAVHTIHRHTGEEKTFTKEECDFKYRHSFFKTPAGAEYIVVAVDLNLSNSSGYKINTTYADLAKYSNLQNPEQVRAAVIAIRQAKLPDTRIIGTAGSFFKNLTLTPAAFAQLKQKYPELPGMGEGIIKVPVGWIIDNILHLKGYRQGNVGVHPQQALVLVADKGATAKEVHDLALYIEKKFTEATGMQLEREVIAVGEI
jgi:UDP-N-acetylmuramate dehydrogenase